MKTRSLALWLACAAQSAVLWSPAAAQGLRMTPPAAAARAATAANAPQAADFIVAVVNSEPITNHEVLSRLRRFEAQLAQQGSPVPPRAQLAREVIERLISEKAQLQLAKELGVRADESLVDQAEQNVARQNQLDVAEFRRRLAQQGIDATQFRQELRNQVLLQRLRDRELESRVKITELDIDQYLKEQQQGQGDPSLTEINLAHILVAVPENATEAQVAAQRAKAQRLLDRAKAGEDFAKLAREGSDAPGAAENGGVVGLRTADRYPGLFVDASRSVAVGGVSELVRSAAGFHIVKVVERRQAGVPGAITQTRARHILLRPNAQLTEEAARRQLADYKRRIEGKQADFAQLAKEHSQDGSAANGGDLGWAAPGMFVPEFEDAMNGLAPGQIAGPIVSRFGVHLIQVVERRQQALAPREQREMVRNLLREKKLDEAYAQWVQEVRGRAYVELREAPAL